MSSPVIRSVALFLDKDKLLDANWHTYVEERINWFEETINTIISKGYKLFTKRVILPDLPVEKKVKVLDIINSEEILVSIGRVFLDTFVQKTVVDLVEQGYYVSLYGLEKDPVKNAYMASEIIHKASSNDPVYATRIAVALHNELLETPYFPDTTSSGVEGVGFSFLFPKHMISYIEEHGDLDGYINLLADTVKELRELVKARGINRVFFDYSISPWMDDSVVELIEKLGYKLLSPGFNYGVYLLKKFIDNAVAKIGFSKGFNEVMLPYAEDNLLKKAGEMKLLKARDLLLYSVSCVAGPDMLVVPESIGDLARFILDTYSIYLIKRRPLALRVIPVSMDIGDKLKLGKFGLVHVIGY